MPDRFPTFLDVALSVPDFHSFQTVDELNAHTQALVNERDPLVRVTRVGASRNGEPIDMISVGRGRRSALLVGTPHPNEPIGCLTIEFLIDRLRRDVDLRESLDCTWHFIKTIEPDGLRLNEGWLKRPLDPAAYLRDFFRPAANEQAEYTFPIDVPGYRFEAATPENLAWQAALHIARPEMLFSLHNCEHGGAFYILSRPFPELAEALARQPADLGIPLDVEGENFGQVSQRPGVFLGLDIATSLGRMQSGDTASPWQGGQSSFGFTSPQGTFGLMVEAPYWREENPDAAGPDQTLADLFAPAARWCSDAANLLDRHLPGMPAFSDRDGQRVLAALRDMRASLAKRARTFLTPPDMRLPAAAANAQRRMIRLNFLRPVATLSRLARIDLQAHPQSAWASAAIDDADAHVARALAEPDLLEGLHPVPLKASVGLQVRAALTTMAALDGEMAL